MQNDPTETGLYTSLEEAKKEIWRRWNNAQLRKSVEDFIENVPVVFGCEPRACLARFVASPNKEYKIFLNLAKQVELKPVGWEYLHDKFCTINHDKLYLGKMIFLTDEKLPGTTIECCHRIIDFGETENAPIEAIKTKWGESLVDFHHRLLNIAGLSIELSDASSWYKSNGKKAAGFYDKFLSLFLCHGILFENFITNEEERFARSVVFPAFKKVVDRFGMKPLIVPLVPHETASDIYWRCYPAELEEEILRCLSKAKDSSGHHHVELCTGKDSGSKRDKN